MNISTELQNRSENRCELCSNTESLSTFVVSPKAGEHLNEQIAICNLCKSKIGEPKVDVNHWRCLNEAMWSEYAPVQVVSYRLLSQLKKEEWASDLLAMLFLSDETKEWAEHGSSEFRLIHKDANGNILTAGDTVTLIQDLNVKGAKFTAKRGTAVRRIRLVHDNPEHIEGKVEGQQIVILTKFVKKS